MFITEQIRTISGIFANLGHIFFASIVLPFITTPQSANNILLILSGFSIAVMFWIISVTLIKEV